MRTTIVARRYLPLAAALGLLLIIIAVFPSTAGKTSTAAASGPVQGFSSVGGASGGGTDTGAGSAAGAAGAGASAGGAAGGAAGSAGGATGSAGGATGSAGGASGATGSGSAGGATGAVGGSTGGSPGAAGGGSSGAAAGGAAGKPASNSTALSGDTTHCVGGREFDPALDYYAPPCTPGTPGAALPSNGGATSQGVTANQVEVVWFVTNYGAVVNAILQAQGLYENAANVKQLSDAFVKFVNSKYVLWGRNVKVDVYPSGCTAAPPDLQCLLPEMDKIASSFHPYAVVWDTTVCSACYAELAKDGVVGVGGTGFTDAFSNQLAPYFYSQGESSTRTVAAFAQFWCNSLSTTAGHGNTAFAGDENNLQDFNGQPRKLGAITPNDPDNINAVEQVLIPGLNQCRDGASVADHHYYYEQNPATAAQQTQSSISAMNKPNNAATSVLCLCDPVAPAFTYGGEKQENYWPESIIASDQGQDVDLIGQSYEQGTACSAPPCEFDRTFGLSTVSPQLPTGKDPGYLVYAAGGGTGTPVGAIAMDRDWSTFNMLMSLIENTGPQLTPARMQAAAPSMGMRGGGTTGFTLQGFMPGDYQWQQDTRIVYFDKNAKSPYNGLPGTFVQEPGTPRYNLGQFAGAPVSGIPKGR